MASTALPLMASIEPHRFRLPWGDSAISANSIPRRIATLCAGLTFVALGAACTEERTSGPARDAQLTERPLLSRHDPGEQPSAVVNQQPAELRRATAQFHSIETAEASGWNTIFPPECLTHSDSGGMGYHRLNGALVDDVVTAGAPELLVYGPRKNGELHLVAVEYIIPFSIRPRDAAPPVLFGREFAHNETYDVWALHAWVWKDNPNGTFANFDPKVSCQYADEVRTFPEGS